MAETLKMRIGAPTSSQYYVPGTSYYASSTDDDETNIYIGKHSSNEPNGYARCVYPSVLQYLKNQGIVSSSQKIKVTGANFAGRNASGKTMSLNIRINNNNTDSGQNEGIVLSTTAYGAKNPAYSNVEWTITDSTVLDFLAKTTQSIVVHVYPSKYESPNYVAISTSNHSAEWGPRLNVTYEVIEDSGGGGDSGGGDDGGGEDTEETVTLDNVTAYLNTSSPTIGNTLSVTVSGAPSGSSYSYSWYLSNTSVGAHSSSWYSGNINVSSYFGSSSKTSSGYVAVTVSYGTLTKTLYPSFTLYLTSSYGPSNLIYSDKSSHSSGSYIPGSKIIWSASATANYGASISRYVLTVNSVTDTVYGASVSNYTSSILPTAQGTYNASIDAYDSRGYSISRSFTITVSSNIAPTINAKVIRCDADGDENMISGKYYKLTGTVSADQTSGTKYITSLKIIASQDGTTNSTISKTPNVTSYNLSNIGVQALPTGAETSFEIKIITSDGTMSREITLFGPSAAYIIHIATGGKSLGLGSAASSTEKTIACGWDLYTNGALETNGTVTHSYEPLQIGQGGTGVRTLRDLQDLLGLPTNNDTIITSSNIDNFVTIDLTGYATQTWVQNQGYTTLNTVQTWVNSKGYLTSLPSNVITTSNIGTYIPNIQTGITNRVAISGDSTYTGTVTFSPSFSRVPQVFVTLVNGDLQNDFSNAYGQVYCCIATNANSNYTPSITTTGFTYLIANDSSSGKGARVQWVAIG